MLILFRTTCGGAGGSTAAASSRAQYRCRGRLRVPDRAALVDVPHVLRTGVEWRDVPTETGGCSGVTAWRPLRDRTEASVTNLTTRQLGQLFGVSSSTVRRVVQRLGPPLALEPVSRTADVADRMRIVDGTLIPIRDQSVPASSRNHRFSANVQVIVDANTRLVIAAARPVPGTTADAHA